VSVLTLYTKPDCHLCEQAREIIDAVRQELPVELEVLDITSDESLHRAYFERIPVLALDGEELCEYFVDRDVLAGRLRAAASSS
jgi:glutaredoxin